MPAGAPSSPSPPIRLGWESRRAALACCASKGRPRSPLPPHRRCRGPCCAAERRGHRSGLPLLCDQPALDQFASLRSVGELLGARWCHCAASATARTVHAGGKRSHLLGGPAEQRSSSRSTAQRLPLNGAGHRDCDGKFPAATAAAVEVPPLVECWLAPLLPPSAALSGRRRAGAARRAGRLVSAQRHAQHHWASPAPLRPPLYRWCWSRMSGQPCKSPGCGCWARRWPALAAWPCWRWPTWLEAGTTGRVSAAPPRRQPCKACQACSLRLLGEPAIVWSAS